MQTDVSMNGMQVGAITLDEQSSAHQTTTYTQSSSLHQKVSHDMIDGL